MFNFDLDWGAFSSTYLEWQAESIPIEPDRVIPVRDY